MSKRAVVWLCIACGKQGKTRETVGDESCYMHSVQVYEDSIRHTDKGMHAEIPEPSTEDNDA